MNLTLQIQLLPEPDQARKLRATVERFNEAANWLAGEAFDRKTANKILLQKLCYAELRERLRTLVTQRYPLDRAPEAIDFVLHHPAEAE